MKKIYGMVHSYVSIMGIIGVVLCCGVVWGQVARVANSGIQPYAENPSYWQYQGQPILLFGGSNRDNIFQWAGDGTKLMDHLDLLQRCGGNYLRCTISSREYQEDGYRWDLLPYPFAKVNGKFDLMQWNDVYWDKLRTFLSETKKRSIIVQLEFWDRWNETGNSETPPSGWYDSPWNPNNNSTYNWPDSPLLKPGRTDFYNAFHMAAVVKDPVLLPLQQRFVSKILDEVIDGGFDHVLFQIDNESGIGDETLEPDPYWARFSREYAQSKGREIYVCTSRRLHWPSMKFDEFKDWSNSEMRVPIVNPAFNFCDISQNNGHGGQLQYDNILWYRSKVLEHGIRPINNVKCYYFNWPIGGDFHKRTASTVEDAGAKFWRAVFGGCASIRFHRYTPYKPGKLREGFGLEPDALPHIRSMRMLTEAVHIFTMDPRNDLLTQREEDEAYCLAETGKQYAVFFTGEPGGNVTLDLSAASGTLRLQWLDIQKSMMGPDHTIEGGTHRKLEAPGAGLWVAILRKVTN